MTKTLVTRSRDCSLFQRKLHPVNKKLTSLISCLDDHSMAEEEEAAACKTTRDLSSCAEEAEKRWSTPRRMTWNFAFVHARDVAGLERLMRHSRYRRVLLPFVYHSSKTSMSTLSMSSSSFSGATSDVETALDSSPYTYIFGDGKFSAKINDTVKILEDFTEPLPVFLYLYDMLAKKLLLNPLKVKSRRCVTTQDLRSFSNLSAYVAREKRLVIFNNSVPDYETPLGYGLEGFSHDGLLVGPVLGVPLLTQEGDLIGVLEMAKDWTEKGFKGAEIDVVVMVAEMIATNIDLHHKIQKCDKLITSHDYLIRTLKKYLFKGVVRGHLYQHVFKHVRKVTKAVNMSYALTEWTDDGLTGDFWEVSGATILSTIGLPPRNKVKLEENGSLMGWVAHNKRPVCISDSVNEVRGYNNLKLQNSLSRECVLCYPVVMRDEVVGVLQLTNKTNSLSFSDVDKWVTKLSCDYAAIAMYRMGLISTLLDISGRTSKLKMILPRFATVCTHDVARGIESSLVSTPEVSGPYECHWTSIIDDIHFWVLGMLVDTVEACHPNLKLWATWVLLVKKTYDPNMPYNNFNHAAEMLYCMYNILGDNASLFREEEKCALMISSLCCDVGHLGMTSNFYELTGTTFARMYQTCPLESAQATLAITLLKRVPILKTYTDAQVRAIIKDVRDCILGTNTSRHTSQVYKLRKLLRYKKFSWADEEHRTLVKAILVMCSSLSDQIKMSTLIPSKEAVARELSCQVEIEKTLDFSLISLEKDKYDRQYYFIKYVCLPCMEVVALILPNTVQLHSMAESVIGTYEAGDCKGMWKPETSYEQTHTKEGAGRKKSVVISQLSRKKTPQQFSIVKAIEKRDRHAPTLVVDINRDNTQHWYSIYKPVAQ